MWAHAVNLITHYLPWASFIAGLTGSIHCVGMCGGLVAYSSKNTIDIFKYQLGRLLAYLFLGIFSNTLSSFMGLKQNSSTYALVPGLIIGPLFIYWGIETFRGKRAEIPMPKWFSKIYSFLFGKLIKNNQSSFKSFFTGLISLFLPCGILYSVVIAIAALETKSWAIISLFFFWLGTIPAMVLAPSIIQNILNPLKGKIPKIYATILIVIGLGTFSYRIVHFNKLMHLKSERPESDINCH